MCVEVTVVWCRFCPYVLLCIIHSTVENSFFVKQTLSKGHTSPFCAPEGRYKIYVEFPEAWTFVIRCRRGPPVWVHHGGRGILGGN